MLKLLTLFLVGFFVYRLFTKSQLRFSANQQESREKRDGDDDEYIDYEEVDE